MANFEAYKSNGQLGAPASQLTRVTYSNSGAQVMAAQDSRAAQGLSNLALAFERQHRTAKIMEADNEYNRLTGDLKQEIYQDREGLAENALQRFEEGERKIRSQLAKKYGRILTYGDEGRRYQDILNKDFNNHRSQVAQFQVNELEKNADTQLRNSLQDALNDAMAGYQDPGMVDGMMNRAAAMVALRYQNYGPERVKEKVRTAMGGMAQGVINRAYANGDNDLAETYIERYGRALDPNVLTNFAKAAHDRRLRTMTRSTAETLVNQFGDNIEGLRKAIYEGTAAGTGFDGEKAVQWMANMAASGKNWGVNTCTKGVNAALEAAGGIPGNTWAPTNYANAQSAGTAFTDRSKLRTGDIVYWDSDKDGEAGHVGVYDAKTGKVYQSGTHGFAAIPLDTYGVIGFARPQGRGMTLEEKDELYNACLSRIQQNKALKKVRINSVFDEMNKGIMNLSDTGNADYATYEAMVDRMAGGDPELRQKGYSMAMYWWRRNVKTPGAGGNGTGGEKPGLELGVEHGIVQELMYRNFENEAEYAQYLMQFNPNKSEYNRLIQMYQDKEQGKGIFKFDWTGMKEQFETQHKLKDETANTLWRGAQKYAIDQINQMRAQGTEPTYQDVQSFLNAAMTTVNYGRYEDRGKFFSTNIRVEPTRAELAAANIVATRRRTEDRQIEILRTDGVYIVTNEEGLNRMLHPNTAQDGYGN